MKNINVFTVFGLLLAAPVVAGITSEIAFCQLAVPRYVKDGNFNFYVIYKFDLDEEGKPSEITKLKNDYLPEEEVKSCLSDWRLEGFAEGAMISVSFHWSHAVGWDRLAISGPNFEQKILLTGERVPYRPVEDPANHPDEGCVQHSSHETGAEETNNGVGITAGDFSDALSGKGLPAIINRQKFGAWLEDLTKLRPLGFPTPLQ